MPNHENAKIIRSADCFNENGYNIDYAFLPMDGIYNMDIDETIECENLIKARHTIPYHMAPGELFSEERANKFVTPTTLIMRPNDIIDIK